MTNFYRETNTHARTTIQFPSIYDNLILYIFLLLSLKKYTRISSAGVVRAEKQAKKICKEERKIEFRVSFIDVGKEAKKRHKRFIMKRNEKSNKSKL